MVKTKKKDVRLYYLFCLNVYRDKIKTENGRAAEFLREKIS